MKRSRKKLNKLDKYLIFSIVVLLLYTVVEQVLSVRTGYERSTLSTCLYSAFGGEIMGCVVIKVFNIKHEPSDDSDIKFYDIGSKNQGSGEG